MFRLYLFEARSCSAGGSENFDGFKQSWWTNSGLSSAKRASILRISSASTCSCCARTSLDSDVINITPVSTFSHTTHPSLQYGRGTNLAPSPSILFLIKNRQSDTNFTSFCQKVYTVYYERYVKLGYTAWAVFETPRTVRLYTL